MNLFSLLCFLFGHKGQIVTDPNNHRMPSLICTRCGQYRIYNL